MIRRNRPSQAKALGVAESKVDRDKLKVHLRWLRRDSLLEVVDRMIDLIPAARLETLLACRDVDPAAVSGEQGPLLEAVQTFSKLSRSGHYYQSFDVNSKNCMEMSRGTQAWMAEAARLLNRCVLLSKEGHYAEARGAFEVLFDLLRYVDEGNDDVVFFADEGGSWQVPIWWRDILPTYFANLAQTSAPEEYARSVTRAMRDFVSYDQERHLEVALEVATPGQREALSPGR